MKVLLVEDEQKIADFVISGLAAACEGRFDAIVLDIMLPGRDGMSVLKALRNAGVVTPLILLTARNDLGDRLDGLSLGADDYLAKPFYVEELVARILALRRRLAGDRQNQVQVGNLKLDRISRRAISEGQEVELTTREFSLLEYLMRSEGQIFNRRQILEQVWGYDFDPSTNVVDVCIKRLRGKLASIDPQGASLIEAVRGAGYLFKAAR